MTFSAVEMASMRTTSLTAFLAAIAAALALFALVAQARVLARLLSQAGREDLWKGWRLSAGNDRNRGREEKGRTVGTLRGLERIELDREVVTERQIDDVGAGSPSNKLFPAIHSRRLSAKISASTLVSKTSSSSLAATIVSPASPLSRTRLDSSTSLTSLSKISSLKYASQDITHAQDGTSSSGPPPYFPSLLPTFLLQPLPSFFPTWLGIDLTVAQAFFIVLYGVGVGLATFWYSTPADDPLRSGLIAMAQVPLVCALGTKNSIVSALIGRGSASFNFLHRFIGRSIFVCSTIHVAVYLRKYALTGTFSTALSKPLIHFGFIAWLALIVVCLASIPAIRRKAFHFFLYTHTIGFLLFLIALIFHVPACIPFCASALAIYGLDMLLRFGLKTRIEMARFEALSDGKTTMVEVEGLKGGWSAGQHVYIRILSPSFGPKKMLVSHPFTIASSDDGTQPLRFFIKSTGPWTSALHSFATSSPSSSGLEHSSPDRRCRVMLDGPYGGNNTIPSSFSSVLLIIGGSGITYSLSHLASLLDRSKEGKTKSDSVDLVWVVPSHKSIIPFLPHLVPLINARSEYDDRVRGEKKAYPISPGTESKFGSDEDDEKKPKGSRIEVSAGTGRPLGVRIHIFVSRPGSASDRDAEKLFPKNTPGLKIYLGRPDLSLVVADKIEETRMVVEAAAAVGGEACGLGIGACGPAGLIRSVREVVAGTNGKTISSIGGVEFFAEYFGN